MKTWFKKFWWVHGERFVYGTLTFIIATYFIWLGIRIPAVKELVATGVAVYIGLLMYLYNKIRGNGKEPMKEEKEHHGH
jgi:hypothetical protein